VTAKETSEILGKFRFIIHDVAKLIGMGIPKAEKIPKLIEAAKAKIPQSFLDELSGAVEGYNQWCDDNHVSKKTTLEELILFHLIPEQCHLHFNYMDHKPAEPRSTVGCTALMTKDQEHGIIFGRNLDWNSCGFMGNTTLCIKRVFSNGMV